MGSLDAENCRLLIRELQIIEAKRQPAEEILRIERKWSSKTEGSFMSMWQMISARMWDPIGKAFKHYAARQQAAKARPAQILVALATRAFELEQGRSPAKLTELVPGYLSALPPDIATNMLESEIRP